MNTFGPAGPGDRERRRESLVVEEDAAPEARVHPRPGPNRPRKPRRNPAAGQTATKSMLLERSNIPIYGIERKGVRNVNSDFG